MTTLRSHSHDVTGKKPRLRSALLAVGLMMSVIVGTVATDVTTTHAAAAWYDGAIQYSNIVNCPSIIFGSPYYERGAAAYVGFNADPESNDPSPNVPYYIHVVVAGLGNSCSGQRVDVNVQLPANTSFAISGANRVVCAYDGVPVPNAECPQSLPSSSATYGAGFYRVPSPDNANANLWPLPVGKFLTIAIPVVTTTAITASPLNGAVRVFDGNSSPVLLPTVGVYVFDNTPAIVPSPAGTTFGNTSWPTTIRSETYLYNVGQAGQGYFDLMTSPGGAVVFTDGPAAVAASANGYIVWADWTPHAPGSMAANTTYYWRFRYVTTGGTTYVGAVQSFTTPRANTSIVGSGTPGSCTGAALAAAAASAATTITFNCGLAPTTIVMQSTIALGGTRVIDGEERITLQAPPGNRHFTIPGGTPTLQGLSLVGGSSSSCGGAVLVTGGSPTFWKVRMTGNTAATAGGALCVQSSGSASLSSVIMSGNSAGSGGGGAASLSGGGYFEARFSSLTNNTTTGPGGGLTFQGAEAQLLLTSVTGNTAGAASYGGGVAVVGGAFSVVYSTISSNSAGSGGGIEQTPTGGYLSVISSTVAANRALTAGRPAGITGAAGLGGRFIGTIVALNTTNGSAANCSTTPALRTFVSQGYNLDDGTSCGFAGVGDRSATDARLLPLAAWGGGRMRHALASNSPAIDTNNSGNCSYVNVLADVDPIDGDGNGSKICDVGDYEFIPEAAVPLVSAVSRAGVDPVTAATTQWTVAFSEVVVGVDAGDFNLTATGVTGASVASVSPAGAGQVFTVTVNSGNNSGTLRLNVGDDGTIRDAASNPLAGAANGSFAGEVYNVNRPAGGGGGGGGNGFVAVDPARLLDSRAGGSTVDGLFVGGGMSGSGSVVELQVAGRPGVPGDVSAVVLNVTAAGATAGGYVTVFPCGQAPPNSSNLNTTSGGTVPNAVTVKVGVGGKVCLFTSVGLSTHLLVDLNGFYPAGSSFVAVDPARLLDSRAGGSTVDGLFVGGGMSGSGSVVELQVAGRPGVPGDVSAVVLNVTAAGATAGGYVTVFPCGQAPPNSSNLNTTSGGTVPNAVTVKVGVGGKVCLFTSVGLSTHLLVDLNGFYPAGSSFVAVDPARLLDSRAGGSTVDGLFVGGGMSGSGSVVELQVAGRPGVPGDVSAVVLNVTAAGATAGGYVTVFPCGQAPPNSSNLNTTSGGTVPNAVTVKVGAGGKVCLFTSVGLSTHLLVDVNGYFPAGG